MSEQQHTWSSYQDGVFNFVAGGIGNAVVIAVAGSGKTTTGVEAYRRAQGSKIFLAFNKPIATELCNRGVNGRTWHSLTYTVVTRYKKARVVTPDKLRTLVDEHLGDNEARMYGAFMCRLVGLARQAGVGCLVADEVPVWQALVEHHDLELENEAASYERGIERARDLLRWSNESALVDFDDLLYIAVKDGLVLPKFDWVFVDEAQDTNAIQRALLRKIMHAGTRVLAVGDPAQAIYGFRGADSNSMNMIKEEFSCTELPLTVSYRCPQAVVRHARTWVSHIEPAPNAPEGAVTKLTGWGPTSFIPTDLVICRTTKPIVSLAFAMLKAHIPARIMGRDIGTGLKALIERMHANGIDRLVEKLQTYTEREVQKAIAKKQEDKAERIQDKTDAVLTLVAGLAETERTIPALLAVLDRLFSDVRNAVTLATVHKAKGLEAPRVFWLNSSRCPAKWARQEWQQEQERNLCYVATTRAMQELVLIEDAVNGRPH